MENEMIEKIKGSIANIESKKNRIYFFVQDTRGNAKASIKYIYDMALTLKNEGYNVIMLYEKKEYTPVSSWLNKDYDMIEHQILEGTNLAISPEDTLVLPEIFGFIMDQVKNLPCGKIVLSQAYDHIYETIAPGASWFQYGFHKCITTSEAQKTYITNNMKNVSIDVIKPVISDVFVEPVLPPKTMIAMVAREQREGLNIIKEFYNKYPQYRFFTFKDLRGLSQEEFANSMKDCFMSVWIDPTSSFGTFPMESMNMGIPVVGKIPHMVPEWMKEENGVWIENPLQFTDVIADMVQTWLEDNLKPELYTNGKETASEYTNMDNFKNEVVTLFSDFINKRKEAFEAQISE
jgi:hypothetical protein